MADSDDKRATPPSDEDDLLETSAADEPTDVWDAEALRAAGLGDVLDQAQKGPATTPDDAPTRSSVEISADISGPVGAVTDEEARARMSGGPGGKVDTDPPPAPQPVTRRSGGMSWPLAIGIALALGAIVYAVVRFAR